MKIGDVNLENDVLIVAEIGNNHEGNFDAAQELVRQAAQCGVRGVKFQMVRAKYLVGTQDKARFDRLTSFELSETQFVRLQQLAHSLGLLFLCTPLRVESVGFLENLVDAFKIASGDNNFYPLIDRVCRTGNPIVMSSGLADLEQVRQSKQFIEARWRSLGIRQEAAVLQCVTSYPVPPEEANVAAVRVLAEELGGVVGYSDHTIGIEACLLSVAMGARIIEKHFTLDKNYSDFRDHQLSADPAEMKQLVERVALVRVLLGQGEKTVQPCEKRVTVGVRRSIVAGRDLTHGHRLERDDLTWIRPGTGLCPGEEDKVVGRTLRRDISFGEPILLSDIE